MKTNQAQANRPMIETREVARALAENADNNWFSRLLLEIPKNIDVPLIWFSVWLMVQPKMEVRHA